MTEIEELILAVNRAVACLVERHRANLVPLPREYIRQVYNKAHPRARGIS